MNQKIDFKWTLIFMAVILVSLARLIPHLPNYSPMAAIALFGGAHFSSRWKAILLTLGATFISDMVLNNTLYSAMFPSFTIFYDGFLWQYAAYIIIVLVSSFAFSSSISIPKWIGMTISCSILFFIVSNFSAWVTLPMYSKDFSGLMLAYIAGLPFLKGTMLSDMVYSAILFGGYYVIQNRWTSFKADHLRYA